MDDNKARMVSVPGDEVIKGSNFPTPMAMAPLPPAGDSPDDAPQSAVAPPAAEPQVTEATPPPSEPNTDNS